MNPAKKTINPTLRQKAEELLKKKQRKTDVQLSETESLKLIHELEVYQIELELQNKELTLAKSTLQKSSEKYAELYDFAPSGYLTLSKFGDIIKLNLTSALMLGKERSKLINSRFSLFVSTDTQSNFDLFLDSIFESKIQKTYEVTLIKDGDIPSHVLLTGILAKNKELCNITMVDITERKRADVELYKSEERYRLIYENTTMGLYRTTPDGRILMANPTLVKILKFGSFEELASRNLEKEGFKQSNDRKQFIERIEKEGSIIGFESIWTCKDGSIIYVRESAKAIRDANGKTLYFDGTVENITERKQAEEKLLFISKAIEASSNAIGISDATGRHFYQNKALSDLFEYETAEELQAAGGGAAVVNDPEVAKEMFNNIMSGNSWEGELEMKTKSGHVFHAHELADAIKDADGKIIGLIGVITDITQRKLAEEALKESESNLRKLNATKDKFFNIIAHDLKSPFNSIVGFSQLLKERVIENDYDAIEKYAGIIEKSSYRAMDLLIDLRKSARDNKDFATSDAIRDRLLEAGIQLKDGKDGTSFSLKNPNS